jgi:hypothetical protein
LGKRPLGHWESSVHCLTLEWGGADSTVGDAGEEAYQGCGGGRAMGRLLEGCMVLLCLYGGRLCDVCGTVMAGGRLDLRL